MMNWVGREILMKIGSRQMECDAFLIADQIGIGLDVAYLLD